MFTGIVQGTGIVVQIIDDMGDFRTHVVELPASLAEGLEPGASVAHNGCCLTVTKIDGRRVSFDLMRETLRLTNLGYLEEGDEVNIERAASYGDEIGGHAMSGHIMCTSEVVNIIDSDSNCQIWLSIPDQYGKYIFEKGYIGIDGISLTIGERDKNNFCVNLIPETLERTVIGHRVLGSMVNIEIDPQTQAIVDTVERVMADRFSSLGSTK
ncbi:riboflavin synthase subunit alpha [Oceanospirillum sediminis]|uniref:Riboflavin synthase n=1 Tax=Oceanospirillum sediminis TaxID=2760088 RepID=A0A839ISH4_9GAMM|nr:riboflavin synthase subunit alpha [Oceanospirillum sediminis]MBB1487429.1 riboflavin synthase subunit alpha [Oceanospirillum sediminis]